MTPIECPDWCTQHASKGYGSLMIESHRGTLFANHLPGVADGSVSRETGWVFHLYVSASEGIVSDPALDGYGDASPGLVLAENSSRLDEVPMGRPLTPEDARELAGALIRGAELVETSRTAVCARCGKAAHPLDLYTDDGDKAESGGSCLHCLLHVRHAARAEGRARLSIV